MFQSLTNFYQRLIMSAFAIVTTVAILFYSHTPPCNLLYAFAVILVQAIALHEFYNICKNKGVECYGTFAITGSVIYLVLRYFLLSGQAQYCLFSFFIILFLIAMFAFSFLHPIRDAITKLSTTLFGILYITFPLGFLIDLNFLSSDQTAKWVAYLIIVTKATDTFSYIVGKQFGKHPLALRISPKKTIEGSIGGITAAVVASALFSVFGILSLDIMTLILLGLALGFFAEVSDLSESLLKRDAHVKDSSNMPGFGGFLDIVDSLLFTTPVLYFYLQLSQSF